MVDSKLVEGEKFPHVNRNHPDLRHICDAVFAWLRMVTEPVVFSDKQNLT
jgi:hypothetical protein